LEVAAHFDETRVPQNAEVLGDGGAADVELLTDDRREFSGCVLATGQDVYDPSPCGLGHGLERVYGVDGMNGLFVSHAVTVGRAADTPVAGVFLGAADTARSALNFLLTRDPVGLDALSNFPLTAQLTHSRSAMNFLLT
jgi:hypothetical protein